MAVEYISYIQTENLFKSWPTLIAIKESLRAELQSLENEVNQDDMDDYIYTQVIGNKVLTDIPPSGKISDTTGNVSASYQQVINRDHFNALEQIRNEKLSIELVDDKLSIAFRRLSPMQQRLLKLFYWENKFWTEVLEELKKEEYFMSKRQAQICRRDSIEKLQSISKITVDRYLFVIKLVEVE